MLSLSNARGVKTNDGKIHRTKAKRKSKSTSEAEHISLHHHGNDGVPDRLVLMPRRQDILCRTKKTTEAQQVQFKTDR